MLMQPTIDGLKTLKLLGMLKALESQLELADSKALSFEERLGLLVDSELTARENRRMQARLKTAKLPHAATIDDIDTRGSRGLERGELASLATSDWILRKQNLIILGATGVGKSHLACALAEKACRDGFTVHFDRSSRMFQELAVARADGTYTKRLDAISKKDLLVIDDFGLFALNEEQRQDLLEIVEDRYQRGSTLITTQLPIDHWHEVIGEPTIADAILDRVVHNSHKLRLKGESRRKDKANEMQLVG
jgi:DNA replication protein DnaC